jgi:hypothetical protein
MGEPAARYGVIVEKFRTAMNAPGNTDPFEVFLRAQGADGLLPDFPSRQNAIFSGILLSWNGGLDAKETIHERADRFCAAAI